MSLWQDFLANEARRVHKWNHYFPAYERHLSRFRNQSVTMIEIGCGGGGSLQMWKRYLGPLAQIVGIDVRPECMSFEESQIAVRIGEQGDAKFLAGVVDEFGPIDIVLDDGSHRMEDLAVSFRELYPRLGMNGVYIAEDIHTSYLKRFGGGYKTPGSFIETIKDLIDELHADHIRGFDETDFTRSTLSLHVYSGLVVFERGRSFEKQSQITGQATAARAAGQDR